MFSSSALLSPPPPPSTPLSLSQSQTPSVCHTRTWQAARVHLCKFILKRSEIVPPHFLLIKISAHVAMIFLRGFSCCSTRPWKTRQGERETFAANVCTCLVLWKQNVGGCLTPKTVIEIDGKRGWVWKRWNNLEEQMGDHVCVESKSGKTSERTLRWKASDPLDLHHVVWMFSDSEAGQKAQSAVI